MIRAKTKVDSEWMAHLLTLCESVEGGEIPKHWTHEYHYRLTPGEVDRISEATSEIYRMCLSAADHIFSKSLLHQLGLPACYHELLLHSWKSRIHPFCFRIDMAAGSRQPTYVDCGTSNYQGIFSASVLQWHWLQAMYPQFDQFNSIWPLLVNAFDELNLNQLKGHNVTFLHSRKAHQRHALPAIKDAAQEASCDVSETLIESLKFEGSTSLAARERFIFNLCSFQEIQAVCGHKFFARPEDSVRWIGGLWTLIFDLPGFRQVLKDLFPRHPLLTGINDESQGTAPLMVRETSGARLSENSNFVPTEAAYSPNSWTRIRAWMVNGQTAGVGIKDFFGSESKFVPHIIV